MPGVQPVIHCCIIIIMQDVTVEPPYNEGPRDWQNLFGIMRFCYIKVLLHILYYQWGKENRSLYRGLCFDYKGSLYRGSTVTSYI